MVDVDELDEEKLEFVRKLFERRNNFIETMQKYYPEADFEDFSKSWDLNNLNFETRANVMIIAEQMLEKEGVNMPYKDFITESGLMGCIYVGNCLDKEVNKNN